MLQVAYRIRHLSFSLSRIMLSGFFSFSALQAGADVTFDGATTGSGTLTGTSITIPSSSGHTAGSNLFHSFSDFNINTGQSVTFTDGTATNYSNVISRVTGNGISTVDGLLQSTVDSADFYFINPNGITFGAGASIDVPAAFHVSTAESLNFANDEVLDTTGTTSTFSASTPESFGFLAGSAGDISIGNVTLSFANDQDVSFVAGDINTTSRYGLVENHGGKLNLLAVGDGSETATVTLNTAQITGRINGEITGFSSSDDHYNIYNTVTSDRSALNISAATLKDASFNSYGGVSGGVGGDISVYAKDLRLDNVNLEATSGLGSAGSVTLLADSMSLLGGLISTAAEGVNSQDAGNITINSVSNLTIDGTQVLSSAKGSGNAGNIFVGNGVGGVIELVSINNASISTSNMGTGHAGSLTLAAHDLSVQGVLLSTAAEANAGDAGDVTVIVSGNASLLNSEILSTTAGAGTAGNIRLGAALTPNSYDADALSKVLVTIGVKASSSSSGSGNAGSVELNAPTLIATDFELSSANTGTGDAGTVTINAISLTADTLNVMRNKVFTSAGADAGQAGVVNINVADFLSVTNTDVLSTAAGTDASDHAGSVSLLAGGNVTINSTVVSSSVELGSAGSAGQINVSGLDIVVANGSELLSVSQGSGDAGLVELNVTSLELSGDSLISTESLMSRAGSVSINASQSIAVYDSDIVSTIDTVGSAGSVSLNSAGSLILDDAEVSSATEEDSSGNAGQVTIQAFDIEILNDSEIASSSEGSGNAGTVTLSGTNLLVDNSVISAAAEVSDSGTAGTVSLDFFNDIILQNNAIVSSSTAGLGDAGIVNITAENLTLESGALVTSAALEGSVGNANQVNLVIENDLILRNTAKVTTSTLGIGNAGSVSIEAVNILIEGEGTEVSSTALGGHAANSGDIYLGGINYYQYDGSEISTASDSGSGGDITLQFRDMIDVRNSSIKTSVFGGADGGGDIDIDPIFIVFSGATIQANATVGNGGNINIVGQYILFDEENKTVIEASSDAGVDGSINTDAADGNNASAAVTLKADFLKASEVLNNACAAQKKGQANTLVVNKAKIKAQNPTSILPTMYGLGSGAAANDAMAAHSMIAGMSCAS